MSIREFNATVIDMINDIATAMPSVSDLGIVANLASSMFKLDPNNSTFLEAFKPIIQKHTDSIDSRDEGAVMDILKSVLPGQYGNSVSSMWDQLTPTNKTVVWDYIELLKRQALTIQASAKGMKNNSELFTLYNNIWKEFLSQLSKCDVKHKAQWLLAVENITSFTSEDKSALHSTFTKFFNSKADRIHGTADIMNIIMPKESKYMKTEIEHDIKKLGNKAFPLNKDTTFKTLLKATKHSYSPQELPVYWHYLKVLTIVLAECPPEIAELLSSMAGNLSSFMGTVTESDNAPVYSQSKDEMKEYDSDSDTERKTNTDGTDIKGLD